MIRALGMVEFNSIAKGIEVADLMMKAAFIKVLFSKHICPGKFAVLVTGDVAAVEDAVQTGINKGIKYVVGHFIIPNAHEDLLDGIKNKYSYGEIDSIGVMELTSIASGINALDSSLKSGQVKLVKLTLGNLVGGKCYFIITGDISSVDEALKSAEKATEAKKIINKVLIPSPQKELIDNIVI